MSIASLRLLRYSLPLNASLRMRDATEIAQRQGLLLEIRDETGAVAFGEIAPLPGWSAESLADTESAAKALLDRATAGGGIEALPEVQGDAAAWHALPPSLRCGLSMALQRHWAAEEGAALYQFLCLFPRKGVPLAPLLTETGAALDTRLAALAQSPPDAVKLKVGTHALHEDVDRVVQVSRALGPGCALRLDANRAWRFDSAIAFAKDVDPYNIDYIEEPLAEPARLPEFQRRSGLPYALDETAAPLLGRYFDVDAGRLPAAALEAHGWRRNDFEAILEAASAVIIKPTLVGEFGRLTLMSRALGSETCRWIVSAAYESGVGIAALAQLAGALDPNDAPAGLDTYRFLAQDLLATPLPLDAPRLALAEIAARENTLVPAHLQVIWE